MSRRSKRRWYCWRTRHAYGPSIWHYAWGSLASVKELADSHSDGIRGYDVRAIKLPPHEWLQSEWDSAVYAEARAAQWRNYIGSLLADPSHPVEPVAAFGCEGDTEEWV